MPRVKVKQVRDAVKAILAATNQFGSTYTYDRRTIEQPEPAAVVMWHDGGRQVPGAGQSVDRTVNLSIGIVVPLPPVGSITETTDEMAQAVADDKLEVALDALAANPSLDTGAGPLVTSSQASEWEITSDEKHTRILVEIKFSATFEEG